MKLVIDPPVFIAGFEVRAISELNIHTNRAWGGACFFAEKSPVALHLRFGTVDRIIDLSGAEISQEELGLEADEFRPMAEEV